MLAMTASTIYHMPLKPQGDPPVAILSHPNLALVAEGRQQRIAVTQDGQLLVMQGTEIEDFSPDMPERITAIAILKEKPLTLVLGTEPAQVYRYAPGGQAQSSLSFASHPVRKGWSTPWGGPPAVRSLAASRDGWLYANVHVGNIMRSADGGRLWEPVAPELEEDVHQVTVGAAAKRVYAITAHGLWTSRDRGDTWTYLGERLDSRYGRAVAVHPADPNLILVSVSDGPHGDDVRGQLHRTKDAGYNWQRVDGFPETVPTNIDTHCVGYDARGDGWAAVGAQLYRGRFGGRNWELYWEAPEPIQMLSCYRV